MELHSGHEPYFGYRPNQPHSDRLHARMEPRCGSARRAMAAADDGGDRYNYRPLVACLAAAGLDEWLVSDGDYLRLNTYNQGNTSTCHGQGNALRLAIERAFGIVQHGAAEDFRAMPAPEVLAAFCQELEDTLGGDYGGSGSGQVEAIEKFGAAYALPIGSYDLSAGNADGQDVSAWQERARQFLVRGVPAEVRAFAREHRSENHLRMENTADLWAALGEGHPAIVGSKRSFDAPRDEEGVIRSTGDDWAHLMCISSRRTSTKHGRLFLIHNSWFAGWTRGPYFEDQPIGSFWATEEDVAEMIVCRWSRRMTVRDCWISTGARGFVRGNDLPRWAMQRALSPASLCYVSKSLAFVS